jgi:hypothetical protein
MKVPRDIPKPSINNSRLPTNITFDGGYNKKSPPAQTYEESDDESDPDDVEKEDSEKEDSESEDDEYEPVGVEEPRANINRFSGESRMRFGGSELQSMT